VQQKGGTFPPSFFGLLEKLGKDLRVRDEDELDAFLACGTLARGFLRLQ